MVALRLDVTDDASLASPIDAALGRVSRIDVLVNNAGIGYFSTIEESDKTDVRIVMEANFWGTTRITTTLLPHLRERRAGHILTVSSIAGARTKVERLTIEINAWESLTRSVDRP